VDAVFLVIMGIGGYMMWAAYKNKSPWTDALATLSAASGSTGK
jgi:hypothetical protein